MIKPPRSRAYYSSATSLPMHTCGRQLSRKFNGAVVMRAESRGLRARSGDSKYRRLFSSDEVPRAWCPAARARLCEYDSGGEGAAELRGNCQLRGRARIRGAKTDEQSPRRTGLDACRDATNTSLRT